MVSGTLTATEHAHHIERMRGLVEAGCLQIRTEGILQRNAKLSKANAKATPKLLRREWRNGSLWQPL